MTEVELPDWLYVFVNTGRPAAVLNLETNGQYSSPVTAALEDPSFVARYSDGSADFLPFIQNPNLSTGFLSPFTVGVMNEYRVEHDAELARRSYFKDAPSRLTGIFAFESMETCQQVGQKFRWPLDQVVRFRPQNVLRATRVNMEIVSLARCVYARAGLDPALLDAVWRHIGEVRIALPSRYRASTPSVAKHSAPEPYGSGSSTEPSCTRGASNH